MAFDLLVLFTVVLFLVLVLVSVAIFRFPSTACFRPCDGRFQSSLRFFKVSLAQDIVSVEHRSSLV
jgi:hypothetical protein